MIEVMRNLTKPSSVKTCRATSLSRRIVANPKAMKATAARTTAVRIINAFTLAVPLNPIERVWKRTRRNCLHNVYFPKLAKVVETVEAQFAKWSEPNAELASLCRL